MNSLAAKNAKGAKVWPMVRLGDVCETLTDGDWIESKDQSYEGIRLIQTGNVGDGRFLKKENRARYISLDTFQRLKCTEIFPGDVLVSRLPEPVGRACVVEDIGLRMITAVDCSIIRFTKDVYAKYFVMFSQSPKYQESISFLVTGTTRARISRKNLSNIQIPLPPIEVQKEIVERLEKELGEADKVAAEFKRMAELADKEFKAELDEMFGGLGEKESGVSSQELGLAAKNAKSAKPWPMVRLGDVCEFRRGLTYAKADEVSYSSKVVLRSNNVDLESGELNLNDLKYLREDFEVPVEKIIEPNTLLMCIANGSKSHLGKVALIEQDFKYAFGGFMGLLVPRNINSKYLYYFLSAPLFKAYVKSLQDGANINNLKFSDFSEFQIPLLPIEVQKGIVAKLDAAKERCEKLKAEAERGLRAAENLRKAILSEAFEL